MVDIFSDYHAARQCLHILNAKCRFLLLLIQLTHKLFISMQLCLLEQTIFVCANKLKVFRHLSQVCQRSES